MKYKVANSLRYNEGDPRKATLGYAMAVFACVLKRTHQCPSYFRVEVRKGLLQVVDRVMEHNHCRIAGDPEPGMREKVIIVYLFVFSCRSYRTIQRPF